MQNARYLTAIRMRHWLCGNHSYPRTPLGGLRPGSILTLAQRLRKQAGRPPVTLRNPNLNQCHVKAKIRRRLALARKKDLYSAETQLVKALPKMAKAANDPALRAGFEKHLEETTIHVDRLEEAAEILGVSPKGKSCKAMKGLVEEGAEVMMEEGQPSLKDLALIVAAQKVEHYEIAGYGSARTIAEVLGQRDVVKLLQATLDEEGATDEALTRLSLNIIPQVAGVEA